MKRLTFAGTAASSLLLISAVPALAQEQNQDNVEVLANWTYDPLYAEGWSVEYMFDESEIVNADGETIGDVENVIFSNDGKVLGIIAEIGGFLDIGDTHISVPWDEVTLARGIDELTVLVTEANIGDYDVLGDYDWGSEIVTKSDMQGSTAKVEDNIEAGPGIFKATDLIGDFAYLPEDIHYGYIADIIVQDGMIGAVVTDAAAYGRSGYYAYPYSYYGATPSVGARYDMPYEDVQIDTIESFDYSKLQSRPVE